MWQKLKDIFDHNRYTIIGILCVIGSITYLVACQPTTVSPVTGVEVTRPQLIAEVSAAEREHNRKVADWKQRLVTIQLEGEVLQDDAARLAEGTQGAYEDLAAKETAMAEALLQLQEYASPFLGPVAPLLPIVFGGLAGLIGLDNRRKDKQIKLRDAKLKELTT